MLKCTRLWPGIWSIFFVLDVEKPKIQSPADTARAKVGRWKLCSFGWEMMPCWAGCDVQQEGRHQRAQVVSEEIITRSGRFMDKIFGQQEVERAWCLWRSYMVAHQSREGTSHVVRWYRGCSPTTFPWGFPEKRLSWVAFSSQQGQEGQAGRKAKLD